MNWFFNSMINMKTAILLLASVLTSNLFALDITTLDGKTYRDCRISRVDPDSICVLWSSSGARIKFVNLPELIRAQYGYDPEKAAAFERAEAARLETERSLLAAQRQLSASQSQRRSPSAGPNQPPSSPLPGFGSNTGGQYAGVTLAGGGPVANSQPANQFGGSFRRAGAQYVGVNIAGPGGAIYGIGYGPTRQLTP
jgi:hypothetical protein